MCMLFGLPGFIQEAALVALSIAPETERHLREFLDVRRERFVAGLRGVPNIRVVRSSSGDVPVAGRE